MNRMIGKLLLLLSLATLGFAPEVHARNPRLLVQVVVGSMTPDQLNRYAEHLSEGGFKRLQREGITHTEACYNYQQTLTLTSLATLTTGAMPSSHGIVSTHWYDYIDNSRIDLIEDKSVTGLEYHTGGGQFSPARLVAPTVGESLKSHSPQSRIVTIALDPEAAIVLGGKAGVSFWMNRHLCHWRSSSYYLPKLPEWLKLYNRSQAPQSYIVQSWTTFHHASKYKNCRYSDILVRLPQQKKGQSAQKFDSKVICHTNYDHLCYTPAGNSAVLGFAKQVLTQLELGADEHPDLLNIYLSTPKEITEAYGPESIEVEDMFYRLDHDIEEFFNFLFTRVPSDEVAILLTSDHGTSPSYDLTSKPRDRFNVPQFEMIIESFLDARYGKADQDWLLEYENKMIYLNHNLIYEKRLSLTEIQNEVATFAMQFRGVSHALSSTAMRSSYFGSGYAELMQNSFYPRHSGDVILNLMPEWIEQVDHKRSLSGSMYRYDRHVPLIIRPHKSFGLPTGTVSNREVDMRTVAPTVAQLLGIPAPAACEVKAIEIR